jgi:hypothetical protein
MSHVRNAGSRRDGMSFWNANARPKLQDSAVRYFRREYAKRLAAGEKRLDVEADITKRIGYTRDTVRAMLRGQSYQWVSPLSEDEQAAMAGSTK